MNVKRYLLLIACVSLTILAISILAEDGECRTATWDGGGADNLASTAANWDLDTAPLAGDSIVISSGSKAVTWDVTAEVVDFNILSGYTGTVTFSVEPSCINYIQSGGTVTGSSLWLNCQNNFTKTGGTVGSFYLHTTGNGTIAANANTLFRVLWISGNSSIAFPENIDAGIFGLTIDAGSRMELLNHLYLRCGTADAYSFLFNNGTVSSSAGKSLYLMITHSKSFILNDIDAELRIFLHTGAALSRTITFLDDARISTLNAYSTHATLILTVDTNGKNITSDSVIVGIRTVLTNSGTRALIATSSFNSSAATAVFNATGFDILMTGSNLNVKAAEHLSNVTVDFNTLVLGSDTTISNELLFIDLVPSHPYGLYYNGSRNSGVIAESDGSYSLGSGVFAWDNATLKITPVITIDLWEHTDTFRNTVWQGYDYWADHDCDLLVTWSMTASEDWLTIDDTGNITGTPDEDGACYYTITVTYSNGETATVSGYVDVVTSASQASTMAVSSMLGALVLVLIVSTVIVMFSRSQRS